MWLWPEHRARWVERDRRWAQALHRVAAYPFAVQALVVTSVLGDGVLWAGLLLVLPFTGPTGMACAMQMVAVGGVNLLLYQVLKRRIGRPRPFVNCPDIRACTRALDQFSFPSGHTLHAVAFAVLLTHHYPALAPLAWLFALLVATSRVVLGLHYPSDVAVGGAIGAATAWLALSWN